MNGDLEKNKNFFLRSFCWSPINRNVTTPRGVYLFGRDKRCWKTVLDHRAHVPSAFSSFSFYGIFFYWLWDNISYRLVLRQGYG